MKLLPKSVCCWNWKWYLISKIYNLIGIEITTIVSNYHIEINPSDAGIYDRIVIQESIKNIAQTNQIDSNQQKMFKGVHF